MDSPLEHHLRFDWVCAGNPIIEDGASIDRLSYSPWNRLRNLGDGRFKLIIEIKTQDVELCDLRADPSEEDDISDVRGDPADHLQDRILTLMAEEEGTSTDALNRVERIGEQTEELLRTLRYSQQGR